MGRVKGFIAAIAETLTLKRKGKKDNDMVSKRDVYVVPLLRHDITKISISTILQIFRIDIPSYLSQVLPADLSFVCLPGSSIDMEVLARLYLTLPKSST